MTHRRLSFFLAVSLFTLSNISSANSLKDFKAEYNVEAMGMTLGKAKHSLKCQENNCTLTSTAKPSGIAAMMSSDSSVEKIQLQQAGNRLTWLKYDKTGISKKDGKVRNKNSTLELIGSEHKIAYFRNNKRKRDWPSQPRTYDSVSIAYAIQHAKLNKLSVNGITLQDSNFQDKLTLKSNTHGKINLSFADEALNAVKYRLESKNVKIDLWLLPKYNYFPGKMRIVNQNNQTITLSLVEPPKIL